MAYLLATTDLHVRWYVVRLKYPDDILDLQEGQFELIDHLDLRIVPGFGNKDTAKRVAKALGLKVWRYVKIDGPQTTFTLE
ncbi:hypothetical protein [Pseudoduganella sp. R-34]|uniref:hypothetical protein n=1 Tax=Pseudoduganella sp. R-34 TaxID=3404062 RepID=UPI003CE6AAD8